MTSDPGSSRRDFLTGHAVRRALLGAGEPLGERFLTERGPVPAASDTIRLETRAMACPWCVILNPGPPHQVMAASTALDHVHAIESRLTVFRDDSEVARINRQASRAPVAVDAELFALLGKCQDFTRQTSGAFDVAVGRLIELWRACRREGSVPSDRDVTQALASSGSHHVILNSEGHQVVFDRAVQLDFGAIGKGFAIDQVAEQLKAEEVDDFLIHGGHSSVLARGDHAGQGGWPVGLRSPLFTDRPWGTVLLRNQALSSSGSNIQYFRHAGRRYGHILDPRSGWPAEGLLSVTVIATDAATADALSTALYVMGLDNAQKYCDHHPEVGVILIPSADGHPDLAPIIRNIPDDQLFLTTLPHRSV